MPSYADGVWTWNWPRKRRVARTVLGACRIAPRSPWPYRMPTSPSWVCQTFMFDNRENRSNRRIRTRMYGGVGGVEPRGFPLSRFRGAIRRNSGNYSANSTAWEVSISPLTNHSSVCLISGFSNSS